MDKNTAKSALVVVGIGGAAVILFRYFSAPAVLSAPAAQQAVAGPVSLDGDVPVRIGVPQWTPIAVPNGTGPQYPASANAFPQNFAPAGATFTYNLGPGLNLGLPIIQPIGDNAGDTENNSVAGASDQCCCDSIDPCGGGGIQMSSSSGALVRSILNNNPNVADLLTRNIVSTGLVSRS